MSLLALIRRGVNARLRKLMLGFVLLGGALGGMAMRPDEIEELLWKMNETKLVTMREQQDETGNEPCKHYGAERN